VQDASFTEDEVLMGKRHWSKSRCRIFNFGGHCVVNRNPDM